MYIPQCFYIGNNQDATNTSPAVYKNRLEDEHVDQQIGMCVC